MAMDTREKHSSMQYVLQEIRRMTVIGRAPNDVIVIPKDSSKENIVIRISPADVTSHAAVSTPAMAVIMTTL